MRRQESGDRREGFTDGIANAIPESETPRSALRAAVNVDITAQGKVKRRRGYRRVVEGAAHSATGSAEGLFVVIDGQLRLYNSDMVPTVLATDLSDFPVSYAHTPLGVFWMNGFVGGLVAGGQLHSIWPEAPGQPHVEAVAGNGGLDAGAYQVAMTWTDSLGRESGATLAEYVNVPENGGIQITNIPPTSHVSANIYVSNANDEKLRHRRTISAAATSVRIGRIPAGKVLDRQFMEPIPIGQICTFAFGRLIVGVGRWAYISEPYSYGLGMPDTRVPMPGDIDMILEGGDGVFFGGGNRVYYASGRNPEKWSVRSTYGHGVVRGTGVLVPGKMFGDTGRDFVPYWLSKSGYFCIGRSDGTIETVRDSFTVTNEDATSGATLVREQGGYRQLITALVGGRLNRAMVSDEASAEVIRNNITT